MLVLNVKMGNNKLQNIALKDLSVISFNTNQFFFTKQILDRDLLYPHDRLTQIREIASYSFH